MKDMPDYIIELDQALDEGMSKAIPFIINQVDKEVRNLLIGKVEALLKHSQYFAYNTDYLNGIKACVDVLKQSD